MQARIVLLHALTPLHAGTGQGVGAIDLPVARDVATNRPLVPGSSIKGVLRDGHLSLGDPNLTYKIFGPPTDGSSEHASALHCADARLLLLPVRSLSGTFAWVTCPGVLATFARDLEMSGLKRCPQNMPAPPERECYVIAEVQIPAGSQQQRDCHIIADEETAQEGGKTKIVRRWVYLEDLDLQARTNIPTLEWAKFIAGHLFVGERNQWWQKQFQGRFCVVHDNVFDYLSETATDVRARVVLGEGKTVENLWYEESLPAESVLAGLLLAAPPKMHREELNGDAIFKSLSKVLEGPLQIGGKATVGRGLCRVRVLNDGAPQNTALQNNGNSAGQSEGGESHGAGA